MNYLKAAFAALPLLLSLAACSSNPPSEAAPQPIEGVEPALPTESPQPVIIAAPEDSPEANSTVIADDVADTAAGACDTSGDQSMVQVQGNQLILPEKIRYLTNNAKLHPRSFTMLDALASHLCQQPALVIEIGVHTDNRGSSSFNRAMSQKRADAVREYLLDKGIPPRQLRAMGFGEDRPITHVPSHELRRTEFVVMSQ